MRRASSEITLVHTEKLVALDTFMRVRRDRQRKERLMPVAQRIAPCLWFEDQAEEAARFYVSIFKNSKIVEILRYGKAGYDIHKRPAGSVMTVEFDLDGEKFTALNGGPEFKFNEAVSLQVICETQDEVNYYWEKLGAGGDPRAQQCGWLKDRYGLSWQVVPAVLTEMLRDHESARAQRAMDAMLRMKKIDIGELQRAVAA
jgi:predicted 3-demethylubiquinone-9 3-methyltransferase (glyoxalase superfamily)